MKLWKFSFNLIFLDNLAYKDNRTWQTAYQKVGIKGILCQKYLCIYGTGEQILLGSKNLETYLKLELDTFQHYFLSFKMKKNEAKKLFFVCIGKFCDKIYLIAFQFSS